LAEILDHLLARDEPLAMVNVVMSESFAPFTILIFISWHRTPNLDI